MKPRVTIGVVTTVLRASFWPWVAWNLKNLRASMQDHLSGAEEPELIWVSDEPGVSMGAAFEEWSHVQHHHVAVGATVPAKRDVVLEAATGDYVAWVDDDDWQHPMRLVWALRALAHAPEAVGIGSSRGWQVDLATGGVRTWMSSTQIHPVSFVERLEITRSFKFCDELNHPAGTKATDSRRIQRLLHRGHQIIKHDAGDLVQFWLKHPDSMHPITRGFSGSILDVIQDEVEPQHRIDLDRELAQLHQDVFAEQMLQRVYGPRTVYPGRGVCPHCGDPIPEDAPWGAVTCGHRACTGAEHGDG